jgi:serine/threonine-protein kinase
MTAAFLDRVAAHFERLRALPRAAQLTDLASLPLDDHDRAHLARMLAADARDDDPIQAAIAEGAARLHGTRGDRLGVWRLLDEIGAGGMGTVFLAERVDGSFDQKVAIKLLRGFPTQDGMRRLRQERQILAGLDHPHIARLLDGGETPDGQPWLAIEYVDGIGLLAHIAAHAPAVTQRLQLFRAMLDAVEHAHQRLVIHRDIKPANVLVTRDGVVKLLDFGIARLVDDEDGARQTSTRVFSRGYASPEQREGRAVTTASDIYSLGVLLEDMLADTPRVTADAGPRGLPATTDIELAGVIAKARAERPADRYAGISDLRDDIARYLQGHPVRAAPLTRTYRLRKFIGRHRWAVAATGLALAVGSGFVVQLDRERERAVLAEAQAQQALAGSERDAASARASLTFLTDAFTAASPEHALSRQVSVRDLLDAARFNLDTLADPAVAQPIRRLLSHLYSELGAVAVARELMRDGLAGAVATDRVEALRLADDYDTWSHLLGSSGDGAAALAAAHDAQALRVLHAPDDLVERVRSLKAIGVAYHRNGEDEKAISWLDQAMALVATGDAVPLALYVDLAQTLSALLAISGEGVRAERVADDALARVDRERPPGSPERILLLRAKANARGALGDATSAEHLLRSAIALQDRVVASGGAHMMELTNDLALMLNDLGRYREAAEILRESDLYMADAGLDGAVDRALSHGNLGGVLESAGDYAGAIQQYSMARHILDEGGIDADNQSRRRILRSEARTLALSGEHDRARHALTELRERALRIDGAESSEYAMLTWQLVVVAREMGDAARGGPLLDDAERLWAPLAPADHPIFLHMRRARSVFALARGDLATAERETRAAMSGFEAGGVHSIDLAIVRSELASILLRQGHPEPARALLRQALPVLREQLLPGEVSRVAAELTSVRIGGG